MAIALLSDTPLTGSLLNIAFEQPIDLSNLSQRMMNVPKLAINVSLGECSRIGDESCSPLMVSCFVLRLSL